MDQLSQERDLYKEKLKAANFKLSAQILSNYHDELY